MAGEAGWRIGRPVVGLAGKGLLGLGGLGGHPRQGGRRRRRLAESRLPRWAACWKASASAWPGRLKGAGTAGMLGGPAVALAWRCPRSWAEAAWPHAARDSGWRPGCRPGIGQAGFTGAWQPLAHAITTADRACGYRRAVRGGAGSTRDHRTRPARFGAGTTPTYARTYSAAAQGFAGQMGDLVNAGPQLVAALKKAGLKSVSLADAFQIAQNALLDMSHAFGKDGKLTKVAQADGRPPTPG